MGPGQRAHLAEQTSALVKPLALTFREVKRACRCLSPYLPCQLLSLPRTQSTELNPASVTVKARVSVRAPGPLSRAWGQQGDSLARRTLLSAIQTQGCPKQVPSWHSSGLPPCPEPVSVSARLARLVHQSLARFHNQDRDDRGGGGRAAPWYFIWGERCCFHRRMGETL